MAKPWDQQTGESDAAFEAFELWKDCPRTVRKLSAFMLVLRDKGIQLTYETIRTYKLRFQWRKRLASYERWERRKTEKRIWEAAAKSKTLILEKRSESTLKAVTMALSYLDQLPQVVTEDAASRTIANINNAMDAVRKVMEAVGMGCVDADDLREELEGIVARKAKAIKVAVREPDPEDLLGLPDESDAIQSGHTAAAGLLESPDRDMPGGGEPGNSNGPGSVG